MMAVLSVAAGGALGAVLRYGVGLSVARFFSVNFPFGTLFVNVTGSFLMAVLAAYFLNRGGQNEALRLFLMTGLLGGFTTFSAFSMEAVMLWQRGAAGAALFYVAASLFLSLGGFTLGFKLMTDLA